MAEHLPDAVLCIGQAGGRVDLTPERIAINQDDARIPDNEGNSRLIERFEKMVSLLISPPYPSKQWLKLFIGLGFQLLFLILLGPLSAIISCIKLFTWRRNNFQRLRQAFSIFLLARASCRQARTGFHVFERYCKRS